MKIWTRVDLFQKDPRRPLFLALGNFDGLHLGHQRILKNVVEEARRAKGVPAILSFFEHPQKVLNQSRDPELLTSIQHRLFLFFEMGIESCFLFHFTLAFSKTPPSDFVKNILVGRLGVRQVRMGYNAHFGAGRQGNSEVMRTLARQLGFSFHEEEPVKVDDEFVSSTLIRRHVMQGELERAQTFLGRPFSIFASVVRGQERGRGLGFPTANLKPHNEILPPHGVYAVEAREKLYHLRPVSGTSEFEYVLERPGRWYQGLLNFGFRPTFELSQRSPVPEVFLFDFEGNLYGKTLEVVFRIRLREEIKFKESGELVRTIKKDVEHAKEYFRSSSYGLSAPRRR